MRRALAALALFCLAGCDGPPKELAGVWSAGPAACAAGVGLEFGARSIDAIYAGERQILFHNPRYAVEHGADGLRISVIYDAPPAGQDDQRVRGMFVLERGDDGWLRPRGRRLEDPRTGTVRVRIGDDPLTTALAVRRCGPDSFIPGLRGRSAAR